mgnify:CR=1 FL=1
METGKEIKEQKKHGYETPQMEVILFETEDVITTSAIELPDDVF